MARLRRVGVTSRLRSAPLRRPLRPLARRRHRAVAAPELTALGLRMRVKTRTAPRYLTYACARSASPAD